MISIISLIYKSAAYADSIYTTVHEFTPLIKANEAEFFFIANDPTEELLAHLQQKNYPYVLNVNPKITEQELYNRGFGWPLYIHYVYCGWNVAIKNAKDVVVLVNSDNIMSPEWLENLYKNLSDEVIVCSRIIENMIANYPATLGEFGRHPNSFEKDKFLEKCKMLRKENYVTSGGAYMPCMFNKRIIEKIGYYPEGNVRVSEDFNKVDFGDQVFFRRALSAGIKHITAMDSISYHFKEGEMKEVIKS